MYMLAKRVIFSYSNYSALQPSSPPTLHFALFLLHCRLVIAAVIVCETNWLEQTPHAADGPPHKVEARVSMVTT